MPEFSLNMNELTKYIQEHPPKGFTPGHVAYMYRGDAIWCYWSDEPSYAVNISPECVLELSMATNQPVGIKLYGIRAKVEKAVADHEGK